MIWNAVIFGPGGCRVGLLSTELEAGGERQSGRDVM